MQGYCIISMVLLYQLSRSWVEGERPAPWRTYNGLSTKSDLANMGRTKEKSDLVPWLAQLTHNGEYVCGGVVVSSRVVLTAAHCVVNDEMSIKRVTVLVGSSLKMAGREYQACKIKAHKKYFELDLPYYYYDIASVLLTNKIEFDSRVQKAKIISNIKWKDTKSALNVYGFGETMTLHRTSLRYVDKETCKGDEENVSLPGHMFCAVSIGPTGDCYSDAGTGVMWKDYVVGLVVVGHAHQCGSVVAPTMYINLLQYKYWIENTIKDLESKTLGECKATKKMMRAKRNKKERFNFF